MVTFVTCFYAVRSKFDQNVYKQWIKNMLSIVNNFNLVIYTDNVSYNIFKDFESIIKNNDKIKIVYKNLIDFHNFQYKDYWINNQKRNRLLSYVDWQLLMLWAEKIFFVNDAKNNKYFESDWYVWCDIGYFRNRQNDTPLSELLNFPNQKRIDSLKENKIYYARINNDSTYFWRLIRFIKQGNIIPENQQSVAGGFFIIHKDKIDWWKDTFDAKLQSYFTQGRLVKDDQIIILHCITDGYENFELIQEHNQPYDNWFLFQRWLNQEPEKK